LVRLAPKCWDTTRGFGGGDVPPPKRQLT